MIIWAAFSLSLYLSYKKVEVFFSLLLNKENVKKKKKTYNPKKQKELPRAGFEPATYG